jgi:hypothetical protein
VEAYRVVEKSSLSQCLHNQLIDGGEVVSLTPRPLFNLRDISGTHFCQRLSRPHGQTSAARIRSRDTKYVFHFSLQILLRAVSIVGVSIITNIIASENSTGMLTLCHIRLVLLSSHAVSYSFPVPRAV